MTFDPLTAKPREVEGYLREVIRKSFGDKTENTAQVTASHGYYEVSIPRPNDFTITFGHFRKAKVKEIAKYLRMLANES